MTVADRVKRGVALLDRKKPTWRSKIDPGTLNLGSSCNCVLGQVYGYYGEGLDRLRLSFADADAYGFDSPGSSAGSYAYLKRIWLKFWEAA